MQEERRVIDHSANGASKPGERAWYSRDVGARRAIALLLATGLLSAPVASLYCDVRDQAAMACCKGDMSECNRPGKTDDCCKTGTANHETSSNVAASRLDRAAPPDVVLHSFASPSGAPTALPLFLEPELSVPAIHSPPLRTVLRV
jgi:hypothetical protein